MPKILGTSKITSKFQVTLPKPVREKLNVKPGELMVFVEENGKIVITKGEIKI